MAVAMMLALAALGLVLVLTSLLVWPVPLGSLALVGLADLWIDFRRQRVAADDS
jgi:hypothetical protein